MCCQRSAPKVDGQGGSPPAQGARPAPHAPPHLLQVVACCQHVIQPHHDAAPLGLRKAARRERAREASEVLLGLRPPLRLARRAATAAAAAGYNQ